MPISRIQEAKTKIGTQTGGQLWMIEQEGESIAWQGFHTGPLTLNQLEITQICRELLGVDLEGLAAKADQVLRPAVGAGADRPAFFLHSTTPELKTFEGDLHAIRFGKAPGDFTTYKETRSVYLSRPGDIVIGRTATWRAAVEALGAEAIVLPDVDHYYLSHALLSLARRHQQQPVEAISRLIHELRKTDRVFRLYAFERELQIFLLWLAQQAGRETVLVEANAPAVAEAWNRKSVLHPTVAEALCIEPPDDVAELLRAESQISVLGRTMGFEVPSLPGYTLERRGRSTEEFVSQLLQASDLLGQRYGLRRGCLKASESGDGARITPGIDLTDVQKLRTLGKEASTHGDDYLLEAHVDYFRPIVAGEVLPTALSLHIRGGELAPGATLQFVEGTSWKGNVYLDETTLESFGIEPQHYRGMRSFMQDFTHYFSEKSAGMVLAGVDFAIGTVGGRLGQTALLGVQDLNVSFTGAECLRAFLERAQTENRDGSPVYGVTRIVKPHQERGHHSALLAVTDQFKSKGVFAETVASIPGRWAMVGIAGKDPQEAMDRLRHLLDELSQADLLQMRQVQSV